MAQCSWILTFVRMTGRGGAAPCIRHPGLDPGSMNTHCSSPHLRVAPKEKPAPALLRTPVLAPWQGPDSWRSGDLRGLQILGIAQHVAAAPDGLDIIVAAAGEG